MHTRVTRREAVKTLTAAGAGLAFGSTVIRGQDGDITIGGFPVEIAISSISPSTVRIRLLPIDNGKPVPVPDTGGVAQPSAGKGLASARAAKPTRVRAGDVAVRFTVSPPTIHVDTAAGVEVSVRNKWVPARAVRLPFVRNGRILVEV